MTPTTERDALIGAVLEKVVLLSRQVASAQRSPFDEQRLTRTQIDTLFLVAHAPAPLSPGLLATTLGITPGAVSQLVDGLRGLGLVEQVANPVDGRSRLIQLTMAARTTVERFEAHVIGRLRPAFDPLTDRALASLVGLLDRLRDTT